MILEIRTYRLKPGTSKEFLRVVQEEAIPLHHEFGISVVDSGASLVAEDGFEEAYVVRSFDSVEHREKQEGEFYGSDAWRDGPRSAVLACIESYHTIVLDSTTLARALG